MSHATSSQPNGQMQRPNSSEYIRPLSFAEAFRFTPLTTSPLQPSDQITLPKIGAGSQYAPLASGADCKAVAGIKITPKVHEDLQNLLQPHALSEFKFKSQPKQEKSGREIPGLSPLARHVLSGEALDVAYRPSSSIATHGHISKPTSNQINGSAYAYNFSLEIPSKAPTPDFELQIAKPPKFDRAAYAVAPESPKRRKLDHADQEAAQALRQRTQRELGDHALQQLENLLVNIFDEKASLEQDDNARQAHAKPALLERSEDDDDARVQLTLPALEKLQGRIKSLIDSKRLSDVPEEQIRSLRQLCEPPITRTQKLNLRLDKSPSDEDLQDWTIKLVAVEKGVGAASVYLLSAVGDNAVQVEPEALQGIATIVTNAFESCIIPVVESRPDGQSAGLFRHAVANQEILQRLLNSCRKLLDQLSTACVQLKNAADCVNAVEFLAVKLIFVQNAPTDKNSVLGSKQYERSRKSVMSSLARLFAGFPSARQVILDEILQSIDKLPSTSRSARQYALGDGKSIMLVSALLLQLAQTCALGSGRRGADVQVKRNKRASSDEDSSDEEDQSRDGRSEQGAEAHDETAFSTLRGKTDELYTTAVRTSNEIVVYLVTKASKVSKTGDSPYRAILDLFIDDVVTLLPLPDWPAAPLLLEILFQRMTEFVNHGKAAGIKNMALESLGTMGAAIAASKASTQSHAANLVKDAGTPSDATQALTRLARDHFTNGLGKDELFGSDGLFTLAAHHYSIQGVKADKTLRSRAAHSFFLVQFATMFCRTRGTEGEEASDATIDAVATALLDDISEAATEIAPLGHVEPLTPREAHLAYLLSILNSPFCRRYEMIAQTLLASLSSDQAQVRSRSIKSVVTMLETDPSLLDSQDLKIDRYIFPCASDDSALVRDAALSLIAQFLITKPAYEERGIKKLIECTGDGKVGVQKRSIGHLSEVYARESRPSLKAWIAETFLRRTVDFEDSVAELARRTLADVWFTSNLLLAKEAKDSARAVVAIEALTTHMISTLEHDVENLPALLTRFLMWQLKTVKVEKELIELLNRISETLFNMVIGGKAKQASLQLLVCLAQARPEAIAPPQLSHLQQYLKNFSANEDLLMFKAVIAIFQHVLPRLSLSHEALLTSIRDDLFKSITKLAVRRDLDDVVSCLRAIEEVQPTPQKYQAMMASIVTQLTNADPKKAGRLIFILGSVAKHIDVEQLSLKAAPSYSGGSVAGFLADLIFPHASRGGAEDLKLVALDSLGCICQAWPAQFNKSRVFGLFRDCLNEQEGSSTRRHALKTFEQIFVGLGDTQDEIDEKKTNGESLQDLKRMGGNDKTQSKSSAISQLATKIFPPIAKIALNSHGPDLLLAVRTITSMSKHGMFHPRDYAGVFVALMTAEDAEVREVAEKAHAKSHALHESVWEREYVNAWQEAFTYQLRVSEDPAGSKQGKAKLAECFATINTSGSKYVKKFVSNVISRLDVDSAKLDISQARPERLMFVRFVAQNLAFFEYTRMEDLLHTILQLELLFGKSGGEVAEIIEKDLPLEPKFDVTDTAMGESREDGPVTINEEQPIGDPALFDMSAIDQDQLKRLATVACALTIISETRSHLKRQYGILRDVRATMAQNKQSKEHAKAPVKIHGITGEKFWNASTAVLASLDAPETMLERCRSFHHLVNVDEDVVVGQEGEEMETTADNDGYMAPASRGKKRKTGGSQGGTPRKRGRPRKTATPSRRSSSASSRDDPEADFMG